MIEVFKTNVNDFNFANLLIDQIHQMCIGYTANFDLTDCDKILRVKSKVGVVEPGLLINLLKDFGYSAEVLPDDLPTGDHIDLKEEFEQDYQ